VVAVIVVSDTVVVAIIEKKSILYKEISNRKFP
jgi:hypothetical protein